MRICQLNPYYFPYAGGIERRIREVGKRLARRHEVYMVTSQMPGSEPSEEVDGIHVRRLPSRFFLRRYWNPPIVRTPRVLEAMRQIRPDIVDYHYRWAPAYARAFLGAAEFSRLVFTYHNTYGEGTGALHWASLVNDWWTKRFIRKADRIVAISDFVRRDLERRGFPAEKLAVVPNGIDVDALRREARQGVRPPEVPERFVVAVGRLVPTKGFDLLVRALPELPKDVHVAVCGEGPERDRLARLARDAGVRDRLHLLGWVPEADKLGLLRDAVAYVHPARFESFGMSVLEAMAMGAPVVATHVGGLPEVVGKAGRLVPPEDVAALAEAVRGLAADEAARKAASRASEVRARAYEWDAAARALERVYTDLLQAPLGSPAASATVGAEA